MFTTSKSASGSSDDHSSSARNTYRTHTEQHTDVSSWCSDDYGGTQNSQDQIPSHHHSRQDSYHSATQESNASQVLEREREWACFVRPKFHSGSLFVFFIMPVFNSWKWKLCFMRERMKRGKIRLLQYVVVFKQFFYYFIMIIYDSKLCEITYL